MPTDAAFDISAAHRHFSAKCFNDAWDLLDKANRTPDQDEAMILAANASFWHWTQRPDCTDKNRSVGHWQLSRINSLLGRCDDAMRHAEQSVKYAADLSPFYAAYAHEAIARAALALNNRALAETRIELAKSLAAQISDTEDRALLDADLRSLSAACES